MGGLLVFFLLVRLGEMDLFFVELVGVVGGVFGSIGLKIGSFVGRVGIGVC